MKPANLILTIASVLILAPAFAQNAPPQYNQQGAPYGQPQYGQQGSQQVAPQQRQNAPLLTPQQLDTIVAPVALYPDPLVGQVLAASTYPLEVVEAQQWLQQNANLHGQDLLNAARQQNWDPSVQALVVFPDILTLLNRDVHWTEDLGNAYLAQQQDVMNAIQRMRFRAQGNGRLQSTPQQTVTNQPLQNGQDSISIEPANPQEVYVPTYNPDYVWGAPDYGAYPPLYYPSDDFGFGFGPGIYMAGFFPSWGGFGWGGWGLGWGWGCSWFGGGIYVNNFFFSRYGFRGGLYNGVGRYAWQHDAFHRAGVPYGNASVAARFNNSRFAAGRTNAGAINASRSSAGRSFGGNTGRSFSGAASPAARAGNYGAGGYSNAYRGSTSGAYNRTPAYGGQAYRGNASPSYSAPSRSYSAPSRSYSAPAARSFSGGGGARSFGGGGGGGHFSGGGGGHSGGGGGHGGGHR